jgi:hypothetical protein
VIIENLSTEPQRIEGSIAFGLSVARGGGGGGSEFKALSITPITAATLAPKERAKLPIAVRFEAAGPYELRWVHGEKSSDVIEGVGGVALQAIFAPRTTQDRRAPWVTVLPRQAALAPGYLADLAAQTTVTRFVMDERFAFDPSTNIGLAVGASMRLTPAQVNEMFTQVAAAKGSVILRVAVPMQRPATRKSLTAFREFLADAAGKMRGTLKGLVIAPDVGGPFTAEHRAIYRDFYLAGYGEAKKIDKGIVMLGAGTAQGTRELLLTGSAESRGEDLRAYVDAIAINDTAGQPGIAREIAEGKGNGKLPIWILPPNSLDPWSAVPSAAALAEEAAVVPLPPPQVDRGVTAHLFGGAVIFQKSHPERLPYIATFQGDGYAVAAVAGLGAGTPLDAVHPWLARTRSVVSPVRDDEKPSYPSLELPDDTRSLRVVDAVGAPVDCRSGDVLFVPASERMMYVLASGNAEDLAALLRPAMGNRLPVMEIAATGFVALENGKYSLTLKLTNITREEMGGDVKVVLPPGPEQKAATTLGENLVVPIAGGKSIELTLPLTSETLLAGKTAVIVEVTTKKHIQRTAVILPQATAPVVPSTAPRFEPPASAPATPEG